jgi:hypothetical protein
LEVLLRPLKSLLALNLLPPYQQRVGQQEAQMAREAQEELEVMEI